MAELLGLLKGEPDEKKSGIRESVIQSGFNTYDVEIEKQSEKLGIGYRVVNESAGGLVVTALIEESAVTEWNANKDVMESVCVGDRILSVNGKCTPKEMVMELRSCKVAAMKLLKAGPRWHILGITAECQYRIEKAMEKGMVFQEKQIHKSGLQMKNRGGVTLFHLLLMTLGTLAPAVCLLFCFSDMFYGLYVYGLFSSTNANLAGNVVLGMFSVVVVGFYCADWSTWTQKLHKTVAASFAIYGFAVGFLLKCRFYPAAPLIICLFHTAIFLAVARMTFMRGVRRHLFYFAAALCLVMVAILILTLWLIWISAGTWGGTHTWDTETKDDLARRSEKLYENSKLKVDGRTRAIDYTWDCKLSSRMDEDFRIVNKQMKSTGYKLTQTELDDRDKLCQTVKTIWFLMWLSPFICVMSYLIVAVFSIGNMIALSQDSARVEKILKGTILLVVIIVMMMWVSAAIAGASMRLTGTLLAFCGTALIALFIWVYLEIGRLALTTTIRKSRMMQSLVALATSNWVRALLVLAFNVLIPAFFLVSMLNQKVRLLRGKTTSTARFTPGAELILESIKKWNWGSILSKVNWLVILYWTFSIGVAKAVIVFLSFLNETLLKVDLMVVIVVFFLIGATMFLLPPVPGIPVYVTSGVILSARASAMEVGFWGGTVIAVFLSFFLKLAASSGQYMIGYFLGKSVKIQQQVGVDKVIIKAIERILKVRGFSIPKVAVLVGGPDWPTSVLCGILRLNLLQVLLGTCPVIIVSTPCVLSGAFLVGPNANKSEAEKEQGDGIWNTLASVSIAASFCGQMAVAVLALYYTQEVIYREGDELRIPRPEHAPIAELTAKEAEFDQAYSEAMEWDSMSPKQQALIAVTTVMMMLSLFFFMFFDEVCFRTFQLNKRIGDSYGNGGLNGDALSLVKPLGWVAQGLFMLGTIGQIVFLKVAKKAATRHLNEKKALAADPQEASVDDDRQRLNDAGYQNLSRTSI